MADSYFEQDSRPQFKLLKAFSQILIFREARNFSRKLPIDILRPYISLLRPQLRLLKAFSQHLIHLFRQDEQNSPCVLQDIVPFGAAALLPFTPIHNHSKQGNGYR